MIVVRFKMRCQPGKALEESLAEEPETTIYQVSSSEPWGG